MSQILLASMATPPPPSSPDDLTGLALWLVAQNIAGLGDGTAVASWTDASLEGNDAVQASGTKQPILKTAILNGLAVVRFDSSDDGMSTPLVTTVTYTIFLVYAPNSNQRAVCGSNNWLLGAPSSQHQAYNGGVLAGPAATNGVFVQLNIAGDGTGAAFRASSAAQSSNASVDFPGTVHLAQSGFSADTGGGDYAEIFIYTRRLSLSDIQAMEAYIANKYGVT